VVDAMEPVRLAEKRPVVAENVRMESVTRGAIGLFLIGQL
jgi:hypothetical protein